MGKRVQDSRKSKRHALHGDCKRAGRLFDRVSRVRPALTVNMRYSPWPSILYILYSTLFLWEGFLEGGTSLRARPSLLHCIVFRLFERLAKRKSWSLVPREDRFYVLLQAKNDTRG